MSFKTFTFDESIEKTGGAGRPYCTEGYYLFEVVSVTPSKEDLADDKWPYWAWSLRIAEGPSNVGRSWTDFGTMEPEKQSSNGRKFTALGMPEVATKLKSREVKSYDDFVKVTKAINAKVAGQRFGALVADGRPYNGRNTSDIQEHLTEEEYRERVKLLGDSNGAVTVSKNPSSGGAPTGVITPEAVESILGDLDI